MKLSPYPCHRWLVPKFIEDSGNKGTNTSFGLIMLLSIFYLNTTAFTMAKTIEMYFVIAEQCRVAGGDLISGMKEFTVLWFLLLLVHFFIRDWQSAPARAEEDAKHLEDYRIPSPTPPAPHTCVCSPPVQLLDSLGPGSGEAPLTTICSQSTAPSPWPCITAAKNL